MKKYITFLSVTLGLIAFSPLSKAEAYQKDYFGQTEIHKAAFEDTLIHLARSNELGFVELRAANPRLDPWIPGAGARIILPKKHLLPDAPREGLVINLAEMRVYFFKDEGKPPITYPISIGREGLQTPIGSTTIVRKAKDPTWRPTERMRKEDPDLPAVVGPGPDNPLGNRALYFGWPSYAMHGTNKPYGIGRRVSSGCIRMYPENIEELYPMVPVGTKVTVVDQPVKVGWVDDQMYIEVSPNQDQSIKIEEDGLVKAYEITAEDMKRITAKAGEHADKVDWVTVRRAVQEHRGVPVAVLDKNKSVSARAQRELEQMIDQADIAKDEVQDIKEDIEKAATSKDDTPETLRSTSSNWNLNN